MTLRVGSWPGYRRTQNRFLELFLDGLAGAGCEIVSLDEVEALDPLPADLDVVLLHWPQRVFWESSDRRTILWKMFRLIRGLRGRGATKVVWLAHDLEPHDAAGMQRLLWAPFLRALLPTIDGVLTLSSRTLEVVVETHASLGSRPGHAVNHPAYPDQSLTDAERRAVRQRYGFQPGDRVLGYCGQLRRNKGVDLLVDVFSSLDDPDLRLFIAGRPMGRSTDLGDELTAAAEADERITLDLRDLDDDGFRAALGVCDLVVAPFRYYLHSGSLVHALSAGRPVLTPTTPFALDLRDQLGPDWVRLFDGRLEAAHLLDALRAIPTIGSPSMTDFGAAVVGSSAAEWLADLAH